MTPDDSDAYLSWVVDDYARELARNGRAPAGDARDRARASFDQLLPRGLQTPRQVLLVGEDAGDGRRIGHLWFGPSEHDPGRAWLYDVTVEPQERGKGFGRALMLAFEAEARRRGYGRVGLNVFGDNEIARTLYLSLGYQEISRQLGKDLSSGDGSSAGGGR
ncbi:MAG: GNAT family N-acetyltransferase [Planctomycetaceae bacterium]